jgi:Domain of unknown function (DUF4440)
MQRIFLSMLVVVSLVGFVKGQQTTGAAAEEAKKAVMQFEKDKVPLILKGGPGFADWLDRVDADDVVLINGSGDSITKAHQVEIWRSGRVKQLSNDQHDHQLFVYDNGNVVIVTYISTVDSVTDGKPRTSTVRCADTWVKQDGKWLRIVHASTSIRAQ